MQMTEVKSSQIKAVGHEGSTLAIQFNSGSTYHYSDVPRQVYDNLLGAESVGRFFGANIKGVYDYAKQPEAK